MRSLDVGVCCDKREPTCTANLEEVNEKGKGRQREKERVGKIRKCRVVCGSYTNLPHTHLQTKMIREGVET